MDSNRKTPPSARLNTDTQTTHGPRQSARGQQNLLGDLLNPETVIRIRKHERDFLIVANSTVQDERLSWEARGLLLYLLSLPADWVIRVSHLIKQGGAGRDSVRKMLRELQECGYASGVGRESQERGAGGRFGQTEIRVYETPALNPFYSAEVSPSPENQSTAAQPSSDLPSPGLPSPENQSTYKEQNSQKTEETKTHTPQTHLRAVGAPAVVVGDGSEFSIEDCRRYADHLYASGQGVNNPGGFARSIHKTGTEDPQIAAWLAEVDPERVRTGELPAPALIDASACPDCNGTRFYYPQGPEKGVAKCKHERLARATSQSVR
jgi:hypothetical protein